MTVLSSEDYTRLQKAWKQDAQTTNDSVPMTRKNGRTLLFLAVRSVGFGRVLGSFRIRNR